MILESWEDRNLFQSLIVYVLTIIQINLPELNTIIEKISMKMKTEIMSLAERLREEGKEIGKEEGKEEGKAEKEILAACNMLKRGLSVAYIVNVMEICRKYVEQY